MSGYGVALGGGGTKGAYHIGVWRALKELDINIVAVTGCSIGSVNGAVLAQNDYEKALKIWQNLSKENVIDLSKDEIVDENNILNIKNLAAIFSDIYKNNGLDTKPLRQLLEGVVDEEKLRNSQVDFGLVTFDLGNVEETKLFINDIPEGMLIDYIMASASLPGLKKTVIDDKEFIDGGFANNIPVDMLISKGIKNVISVDVGGVGITKGVAPKGVNVINIKSNEKIIGHLDFTHKNIDKMMRAGYIDCLKAFGRLEGEIYAFNISDYHKIRQKYSMKLIEGVEQAADIYGIDRYKIYKFDDLLNGVLNQYKEYKNKKNGIVLDGLRIDDKQLLTKFTGHIMGETLDDMAAKLFSGIISNISNSANAIAYFLNNN